MTVRQDTERLFHDAQAEQRRRDLAVVGLRFDADDFLGHETWIRPAFALLGDVAGRRVLDCGCGHGMASVVLAQRGATVAAFDLSAGYVRETLARAEANGVAGRVAGVQAAAERLPFADASFDRVWGHAILHHLDLPQAAAELRRVLKPGGWAVFCEPWGGNPLLEFARRRLPYPGKHRSPDELPLRPAHVAALRPWFRACELRPFQLAGMLRRVRPRSRLLPWLDRLDAFLLRVCPGLGHFCRYVVLKLTP